MMLPLTIAALATPGIVIIQGLHNRAMARLSRAALQQEQQADTTSPRRGRYAQGAWHDIDEDDGETATVQARLLPSTVFASQVRNPLRPIAALTSGFLFLHIAGTLTSEGYRTFSSSVDRAVISMAETLVTGGPR